MALCHCGVGVLRQRDAVALRHSGVAAVLLASSAAGVWARGRHSVAAAASLTGFLPLQALSNAGNTAALIPLAFAVGLSWGRSSAVEQGTFNPLVQGSNPCGPTCSWPFLLPELCV